MLILYLFIPQKTVQLFPMKALFLFLIFLIIGIISGVFFFMPDSKPPIISPVAKTSNDSFFSLEDPPSQSLQGEISSVVGDVLWQSRLATEPAALAENRKVRQGELVATGEDGSLEIHFEGEAEISVSPNSKLDFVQTLPKHIVVVQSSGSARYKTESLAGISVRSLHLLGVISKSSDVEVENEEGDLTIIVHSGSVKVGFNDLENLTTTVNVGEGETYVYDDEARSGEIE